jgi:primosomal protein N' (replication factor Y)
VVALTDWASWRWAGPQRVLLTVASPERAVRELPRPPAPRPGPPAPQGPLGAAAAAALGRLERPTLIRVGPATDLLEVVVAACLGAAGPVLVLVPELGWAERLRGRLTRREFDATGSWTGAAAGWPVVVGARSGAFAPAGRLGAAVVLDAHDEAYREERSPQFDAATVVAERCRRDGAPCLFTSATPSAAQVLASTVVELPRDLERGGWPALHVIDRRGADPRTGLYSEDLVRAVRAERPLPVLVVYNRRGRARLLACARCGELARCERCGRSVVEADDRLACATCGTVRPRLCAACGHGRLKVLRAGVSRVRKELAALSGNEVGEVSGDAGEVPDTPVIVGTEAVLHRVRRASVVAFLDFDLHLLAPRLAAGEQSLALLARAGRLVGGRAARGAGLVFVQTRLPDHEVLAAASAGDPGRFLGPELAMREELSLPPFAALAQLSGPGAADYAKALALEGSPLGGDRWLVRAEDHERLCDRLAAVPRPRERVRVVVDPPGV